MFLVQILKNRKQIENKEALGNRNRSKQALSYKTSLRAEHDARRREVSLGMQSLRTETG